MGHLGIDLPVSVRRKVPFVLDMWLDLPQTLFTRYLICSSIVCVFYVKSHTELRLSQSLEIPPVPKTCRTQSQSRGRFAAKASELSCF